MDIRGAAVGCSQYSQSEGFTGTSSRSQVSDQGGDAALFPPDER